MEENEDGDRIPTGRILFTTVRHSYSKPIPTLAYRKEVVVVEPSFERGYIEAPRVVWDGEVNITADAAIAATSSKKKPDLQPKVQAFLQEMLKDGKPVPQKEIEAAAAAYGFTDKQLRLAKEKLGIHASKEPGKMGGGWLWSLGSPGNRRPVRF